MRKAVFRGFVKIIVFTLAISTLIFSYFFINFSVKETERELLRSLSIMDYSIDYSGDLQKQVTELSPVVLEGMGRITVIDREGNVKADTSDKIDLEENHMDREEIKEAAEGGVGLAVRRSSTLGKELMYAAIISKDGEHILRLAAPYNGRTVFFGTVMAVILVGAAASGAAAYFIAKRISFGITKPLSEISNELLKIKSGEEKLDFKDYEYEEINNIICAAERMSGRIEKTVLGLRAEKEKVEYILDNMSEGIIFIDGKEKVININKAALEMLGSSKAAGENIVMYTSDINIWEGAEKAVEKGNDSVFDIKWGGERTALVHIKSIAGAGGVSASILLTDVTAQRESERMRSEFFSNASHELKTPLTSIRGYSELITGDMSFSDEQKREFVKRIKKEAENMASLINDILMISRLESGEHGEEKTEIRLGAVVGEILETEAPAIRENGIEVINKCEDVSVVGEYRYYYQLLLNLIDNAIKYNKPEGKVVIEVFKSDKLNITVSDTGIGISSYDKQRVFERFYRACKGRDKKVGGTGLGLAIVKHIAGYFGGEVELESELGVGTVIKVRI